MDGGHGWWPWVVGCVEVELQPASAGRCGLPRSPQFAHRGLRSLMTRAIDPFSGV
jgi:hypothetical protein